MTGLAQEPRPALAAASRDPLQGALRDLLVALFRRKWSVLVILATAFVSAVVWLWVIRDQVYEVSAKLLVRIGNEQTAPPTVLDQRAVFIGARTQDVNSEADILHNRDLLAKVVDELGLDKPGPPKPAPTGLLPWIRHSIRELVRVAHEWLDEALIRLGLRDRLTPREKAIALLDQSLLVTPQRESNVLVVRLFLPEREGGGKVLNTLLDFYQDFRLGIYQNKSGTEFLAARVAESEARLRDAETHLDRVEKAGGILALEEQKKILLAQLADAQNGESAALIQTREAADRLARLDRLLATPEPDFAAAGSFTEPSLPQQIVLDLATLQKERERLRVTDLEGSIRIQNNRKQFAMLLEVLRSNLQAALEERQSALDSRSRTRAGVEAQLDKLQGRQTEWTGLKRASKSQEESYLFYSKRLEEASANDALKLDRIGNVTVIEHGMDAFAPAGMRRSTMLGLILALALFAALAYVAVAEFFDNRVWSAEAFEARLGVPALASVPAPAGGVRRRGVTTTADPGLAAAARPAALFLAAASRQSRFRSVLLAGTEPGDAAWLEAVRLAREIQGTCGLRPLIVEFSSESPALGGWFDLDEGRTLRAVAQGRVAPAQAVQAASGDLAMIPTGRGPATGNGLVDLGGTLGRVLEELADTYDVALVVASPLPASSDALLAARVVPRAILIVESGRARTEVLARAKSDLQIAGTEVLGAVITGEQSPMPRLLQRWLGGRA